MDTAQVVAMTLGFVAAVPEGQYFTIVNNEAQMCINGGEIDVCDESQAYMFTRVGEQSGYGGFDGVFTIKSVDGRCLSASGHQGDLVTEADCRDGDNDQKWMTKDGDEHWLYHYGDSQFGDGKKPKCLDVPSSNYVAGKKLQLYDCLGGQGNQEWRFYEALPNCQATNVTGYWQTIESIASAGEEITTKIGTEVTHSTSRTESWRKSVSTTISKTFEFGIKGGGPGPDEPEVPPETSLASGLGSFSRTKSVTTEESKSTSETVSESIKITTEIDHSVPFNDADVGKLVWQWRMEILDSCGNAETVKSEQYAITPDRNMPPCCLPTYAAADPSYQKCLVDATNICEAPTPTVEPTSAPTTEPTSAPTAEPTSVPTAEPTSGPTAEPTSVPTVEPTSAPSAEPTSVPTAEPTSAPVDPTSQCPGSLEECIGVCPGDSVEAYKFCVEECVRLCSPSEEDDDEPTVAPQTTMAPETTVAPAPATTVPPVPATTTVLPDPSLTLEQCHACFTMCAPCQACADGPAGSFVWGSCEKCWHCWNIGKDELKDDDDMDKDCDVMHHSHDWDEHKVRCLTDSPKSSKVTQDCRLCWATFGDVMSDMIVV